MDIGRVGTRHTANGGNGSACESQPGKPPSDSRSRPSQLPCLTLATLGLSPIRGESARSATKPPELAPNGGPRPPSSKSPLSHQKPSPVPVPSSPADRSLLCAAPSTALPSLAPQWMVPTTLHPTHHHHPLREACTPPPFHFSLSPPFFFSHRLALVLLPAPPAPSTSPVDLLVWGGGRASLPSPPFLRRS
ncbi:hypothetical protein GGTG_09379 [Gaeumannomyces tritici R3-111a-1]|uniref:Uncharacterized protein n=1 Tax=Gaeumannomyces tritici (strain R3-111a-1) TaxID=644352 RepID=J3P782_GAET3|nr:hypothetical protein GGTG_09379 [Gaeumannomyces tritici R3-111a-1]EJT72513.1 hypothetical protein GGTG_09379 [Gaeumannomyces tritici R3-111a-1]